MKKEQLEIFATAAVCMDMYKSRFDNAKAKKEERFKTLKSNFVPGSPMYIQERDKIVPEYEQEIEDAREELSGTFEDAYMRTVAREKAAVTAVTGSTKETLAALKYLEDMPVSLDEYNALTGCLGGKLYWIDRFFERVADKNGIAKTGVQPSLTVKLEILGTLAANVRQFISEYDGDRKNFALISSEKYLFNLEDKYTNGYSGIYLNDKEQAKRMVSKALGKGDSLERSCTLANMLRTAAPDMQNEILSILAEGGHPALSDPAMQFTGVKEIVDRFRKEDLQDSRAADAAMEQVNSAKSRPEYAGAVYDNFDNRHFRKKMEEKIAATNDRELKECYENVRDMKQNEAGGANKGE